MFTSTDQIFELFHKHLNWLRERHFELDQLPPSSSDRFAKYEFWSATGPMKSGGSINLTFSCFLLKPQPNGKSPLLLQCSASMGDLPKENQEGVLGDMLLLNSTISGISKYALNEHGLVELIAKLHDPETYEADYIQAFLVGFSGLALSERMKWDETAILRP